MGPRRGTTLVLGALLALVVARTASAFSGTAVVPLTIANGGG